MMGNTPLSTPWSQSKYSPDGHLVNEPGGESWSSVNNGPSSRGESGLDAAPGLRTVRGSTAHCFDPADDPELVISGYSFIEPIPSRRATRARLLRILSTRDSHRSERMGRGSARLLYCITQITSKRNQAAQIAAQNCTICRTPGLGGSSTGFGVVISRPLTGHLIITPRVYHEGLLLL